jgi:hypothetical protein
MILKILKKKKKHVRNDDCHLLKSVEGNFIQTDLKEIYVFITY